ncbi:HAD-IA family hydrolase, partial [Streptomyces sp. NPDC048361]|uniref:HAD family hydrolase n=1 Tax=Streptomyces sp. NPDC048361 TaxID=3154720 RepID=UPI003439B6C6
MFTAAPPPRVDALLCDFDGVLRRWDPDGMTALDRAAGLPEGTLADAAFRPALLADAVTGVISDAEWRARVARDLAGTCGADRADEAVRRWSAVAGEVDGEVLALLAGLRGRIPLVLVSNATTRLEDDLHLLGLADAFDAVVNTARLGFAKPDPRVFEAAARQAGADPRRCLFVDDTAGHVEAARVAGLIGHHYRHVEGLRGIVAPLLGPPSRRTSATSGGTA